LVGMAFLSKGHLPTEGPYTVALNRCIDFILDNQKPTGVFEKGSAGNGPMYAHNIATLFLSEVTGMVDPERQRRISAALPKALALILRAQAVPKDENSRGGWRYNPGEPGDTTVTGWMLMALKSGQMARLDVKSPAVFGAQRFLNSVQNQDGSQYGYQSRKPRPTTTAVALLCRMYGGWRRDNPGLVQGVANLNAWGPLKDSLYYDYYATQVLFHWAGPEWDTWNVKMREHLISSQAQVGHKNGSWYFESQQSAAGGRLYNTAIATMILEVYYRFMPLYGEEAVEGVEAK